MNPISRFLYKRKAVRNLKYLLFMTEFEMRRCQEELQLANQVKARRQKAAEEAESAQKELEKSKDSDTEKHKKQLAEANEKAHTAQKELRDAELSLMEKKNAYAQISERMVENEASMRALKRY